MKYLILGLLLSLAVNAEEEKKKEKSLIDKINATIEISELEYKSVDHEYELDWSMEFSNVNQEKYEYSISFSHSYDKTVDSYSKEETRDVSHEIDQEFDINKIWKIIGYTSNYSVSQQRENGIYLTKYDASIAPLGIKFDLHSGKILTNVTLSFLPTYSYLETDDQDEDLLGNPITVENLERSIKYTLRLEIEYSFFKGKLTLSNDVNYARVRPFDKSIEDERDFTFDNDFSLNYEINKYFSFSYNNSLSYDDRRKKEQLLDSTNHDQSFSLSFNWSPE